MKAVITDMTIDSDFPKGSVIFARVRLLGSPEEAQTLMHKDLQLDLSSRERAIAQLDIQKGDDVKYLFIRGAKGTEAETSVWMKVKSVKGDLITTSNNGPYGPYEFRVLRCQILEHKPKKNRSISNLASAPKGEDVVSMNYMPQPEEALVSIQTGPCWKENTDADPLESLRKQVQEFELK